MVATQFSHNSFLYSKYIIRKGNGTFVSSAYLKLQSFFILIPGSPKLPGPPKTFSFILYTYHSQNQRAKRTAKPFRPLIFAYFLLSSSVSHKALSIAADIKNSTHQTRVFRSSPIDGRRIFHRPPGPRYSHAAPSGEDG